MKYDIVSLHFFGDKTCNFIYLTMISCFACNGSYSLLLSSLLQPMVSHLWKSVMPDLDTMERDRQLLDITHPNRELCQESAVSDIYMILGGGAKGGVTLAKKEVCLGAFTKGKG